MKVWCLHVSHYWDLWFLILSWTDESWNYLSQAFKREFQQQVWEPLQNVRINVGANRCQGVIMLPGEIPRAWVNDGFKSCGSWCIRVAFNFKHLLSLGKHACLQVIINHLSYLRIQDICSPLFSSWWFSVTSHNHKTLYVRLLELMFLRNS